MLFPSFEVEPQNPQGMMVNCCQSTWSTLLVYKILSNPDLDAMDTTAAATLDLSIGVHAFGVMLCQSKPIIFC